MRREIREVPAKRGFARTMHANLVRPSLIGAGLAGAARGAGPRQLP